MPDSIPDGILRRRQRLLAELAKVQTELGMPVVVLGDFGKDDNNVAELAPSRAIRRLLAHKRMPLEPGRIIWALIAGNARVGSKYAEANILRAIRVNLDLGLLIEKNGRIGLPEWKFYERLWRRGVKEPRIRFVMERMHAHLGAGISVAQLAKEVGLSPSRLTHLFENEVSVGPKEYMRRVRMRIVLQMLRATNLKQKEILALVGIADRSHFSREFKAYFKSSPSMIRQPRRKSLRRNHTRVGLPPELEM